MTEFSPEDSQGCFDEEHEFQTPKREILLPAHMKNWQQSEAYLEYVGFIMAINSEVSGHSNNGIYSKSGIVKGVLQALDTLSQWIDEIPPIAQPQRYGNQAFRQWYTRLKEEGIELLRTAVPPFFHQAMAEMREYFFEGFGNSTRIDYGTGHEMSFCMFLCSMFKVGAFKQKDKLAVACYVFTRYLEVCRKLQTVYMMEPAGSRGVWALDDFQFVPFIWGSSQLISNPRIEPSKFYLPEIVEMYAQDYMFIGCIKFISLMKRGPFAEHSNQLWNISGVPSWERVNTGLVKMYKAEVLAKFPVIQHVLFGSILPLKVKPPDPETEKRTKSTAQGTSSRLGGSNIPLPPGVTPLPPGVTPLPPEVTHSPPGVTTPTSRSLSESDSAVECCPAKAPWSSKLPKVTSIASEAKPTCPTFKKE